MLLFPGRPPGSKDDTGCNDEMAQATGKTEDSLRGNGDVGEPHAKGIFGSPF